MATIGVVIVICTAIVFLGITANDSYNDYLQYRIKKDALDAQYGRIKD